jgi:hypothetical protein
MNLKMNAVVVALLATALSGCVRVEMPDHMVSDAVDAGKDLYRSVERAFRSEPKLDELESNSNGSEFRIAQAANPQTPVGDLKRSCMETLLARTREKVGRDDFEYKVIDQRVESKGDDGVVVLCQIAIARPKPPATQEG